MRFVIDRCDVCRADYDVQYPKPIGWITWKIADFDEEGVQHERHFCSEKCLRQYLQVPVQQGQLEYKARRFLLVDGETADIIEGVKWLNGSVALETEIPVRGQADSSDFRDWEEFKAANEGSGVQWIDKEVSK